MSRIKLLCDALDNQRGLTKWYLKKIPQEMLAERIEANGVKLNSPLWLVSHLIWTDYSIGLFPLGFKDKQPEWLNGVGFKSSGEMPENAPNTQAILDLFDSSHQLKLDFFQTLDEAILDEPYAVEWLGFKNNYYALLHLLRHEGVHTGGIATFCKLKGIKTV
ncbi:MAG: DinB family protein [Chitinophagales bacterium]